MIDQKTQTILKASELCEYKNSLLGNEIRHTPEVLAAMGAEGMTGSVMNTNGIKPDIIGIIEDGAAYTPNDLEIREQVSANRSAALKKPTEDLKRWVSDRQAYYEKYKNTFWKILCPPVYESAFNKARLYQNAKNQLESSNTRSIRGTIPMPSRLLRFPYTSSVSLVANPFNPFANYEATQDSMASYPWNITLGLGICFGVEGALYGKEALGFLSSGSVGDFSGFDVSTFKDWRTYASIIGGVVLCYLAAYAQRYFARKSFLNSALELEEQLIQESNTFELAKNKVDWAEREEAKARQTNAAN